jgi:hypothetical protein
MAKKRKDPAPAGTDNPYLERFHKVRGHEWLSRGWGRSGISTFRRRDRYVHMFSFAVPAEGALKMIEQYSPIVEVGAGSGYWAWLLRNRGVEIAAYDPHPYDGRPARENSGPGYRWRIKWTPIEKGTHRMVKRHPDRALLLIWPNYNNTWAERALNLYKGDTVIYIGESQGGCCATDEFFRTLYSEWDQTDEVPIPQWDGMHDHMSVHKRHNKRG